MRNLLFKIFSFACFFVLSTANVYAEKEVLASPDFVKSEMAVDQSLVSRNPGATTNYGSSRHNLNAKQMTIFGQQIFDGGFSGLRTAGLNPLYKVSAGDQVIVRIWGAVNVDRVLPVDPQGNLFIPSIGPVNVAGVSQGELNQKVKSAIKSIYPKNVNVYTQLQGPQPVGVFVTGFVKKPGRYSGSTNDSILFFLDQAIGIEEMEGSYRNIKVLRKDVVIAQVDLYEFLISGKLPSIQFYDGDVVLVEKRKKSVEVIDQSGVSVEYEIANKERLGSELFRYVKLKADVSNVMFEGSRQAQPFTKYLTLSEFKQVLLENEDRVSFIADKKSETILVHIEGSFTGKSHFVLPKDARLKELLNNVEVDQDLSAYESLSLKRKSVAIQQKMAIDESLRRLENAYLTATSSTAEEASIRIKEAELIAGFVARASQVQPDGGLVVALDGGIEDIRLQDGDIISIPQVSDSILISGQVLMPKSVVYREDLTIEDYINSSGGYTAQADEDNILIIRQSGLIISDLTKLVKPGDEILVLPKVPTKNIQLATSISQIMYQIAVAAKVIFGP
jgi:protein involved in polysaccharide export with SLBB domain